MVFKRLRALREFERQQLGFLESLEDYNLLREIGHHEAQRQPLALKQLFLLDAGSVATVQRRLRRLRQLGVVQQRRSASDRRVIELTLSPKARKAFTRYESLLSPEQNASPRHACALYDGDDGPRKLAVAFLAAGLREGDHCMLVAAAEARDTVLAVLGEKRKEVMATEGESTSEAQLAFFKAQFAEAKKAGRAIRLVGDMRWALEQSLPVKDIMRLEAGLDLMAKQYPLRAICLYDARHFTAPTLVQALKHHWDNAHHPVMLA